MEKIKEETLNAINKELEDYGLPPYDYTDKTKPKLLNNIPKFFNSKHNNFFRMMVINIKNDKGLSEDDRTKLINILKEKRNEALVLYNNYKDLGYVDESGNITGDEENKNMEKIKEETLNAINKELKALGLDEYYYKPHERAPQKTLQNETKKINSKK